MTSLPIPSNARELARARPPSPARAGVLVIGCAALLAAGASLAAEPPSSSPSDADVEAKLAAARDRLDKAAREVAELSMRLAAVGEDHAFRIASGLQRGVIGLQLDPASGSDGARVMEVSPGGPAAEAGVRVGDVILEINGVKITGEHTARQVIQRMSGVGPDGNVKLRILREGKTQDLNLTARSPFAVAFGGNGFNFHVPAMPAIPAIPAIPALPPVGPYQYFAFRDGIAGMELATLTPGLGQYFGTDKGVLVIRAPASTAFKLEDGDVILTIDGREPKDGTHATRILRSYQPGEKIELKIMRQKKPLTLAVAMPDATAGDRAVALRLQDDQRT
jgi:S1-C subfamily serine protease